MAELRADAVEHQTSTPSGPSLAPRDPRVSFKSDHPNPKSTTKISSAPDDDPSTTSTTNRTTRRSARARFKSTPKSHHHTKNGRSTDSDLTESETEDVTVITGIEKDFRNYIKRNGPILHQNRIRLSKALSDFQSKTLPSQTWVGRCFSSFWSGEEKRDNFFRNRIQRTVTDLLDRTEWSDLPGSHLERGWFGPNQTAPTGTLVSSVRDQAAKTLREISGYESSMKETTAESDRLAFNVLHREVKEVAESLEEAVDAVEE